MTITDTATTSWIRRWRPSDNAEVRLVCFPHAGGSASYFNQVAARFAPAADVVALQYPGRQDRRHERCVTDLATLADLVTTQLLTLSDKPTVFFGHSMGALLAFETARRLSRQGSTEPRALFLSGRRAPSTVRDEDLHRDGDDRLIAELRELSGTTAALMEDKDIMKMVLDTLRGDLTAVETYVDSGERVSCPVTVFTGDSDPKTSYEEASRWRDHTDGAFRIRVFPGGHFFLDRHASAVCDEIDVELGRCSPAGQHRTVRAGSS